MFDVLDRQTRLTGNQKKIIAAAVIGDALEFFDYFLIGFVLAFLIGPWKLTFGQSAIVLLSSGVGAILGAYIWGWLADRIGRRKVFIGTVLNFSIATGLLYFTPENGWVYITIMRFFVGFGVGGLYCVDLPLVQEFVPARKRGWVGGLVTCVIPLGVGLGAVLGAFMGADQWRLLFAIGVLPSVLVLLVRLWVPESPVWLVRQGRYEEARKSLAWALQMKPSDLPLPKAPPVEPPKASWLELFKYPRSLLVSWLGNAGAQTGVYGITLWAPSLFVLLLSALIAGVAGMAALAALVVVSAAASLLLVIAVLLMAPVLMAMWFAPALVMFHRMTALDAMRASFFASLRNAPAFIVFSLVYIVLVLLASIPAMLGWLLLLPVTFGAMYSSYRDVFRQD